MLSRPLSIYINWAAYDELSDTVELTEELALRQFEEMIRLRGNGVRFDAYVMDCFWFDPDGGFRTWRQPHWPNGPDRWLARCREENVLPGLWFPVNAMVHPIEAKRLRWVPEWEESLNGPPGKPYAMCLFYGGYLAHLMESLDIWYQRGVRIFKFDFANFDVAPQHLLESMLPREIRAANVAAFQGALRAFRRSHPEVIIIGYNGFEEALVLGGTSAPLRKVVDTLWLESLDTLYSGDPRPADVPAMNFWRAKDIYSDHNVRYYEFNNFPLHLIDNSSFMIGLTGTCYYRGTAAWQGMLLLSLARGGWANTYYGNLELLDEPKAKWFARVQALFYPLQADRAFSTFGALPGSGLPYGFVAPASRGGAGSLVTVMNPGQTMAEIALPLAGEARVLFRDAGFKPVIKEGRITLGPEQLALVGIGSYAKAEHDLGVQEDVVIPSSIEKLAVQFSTDGEKAIAATVTLPAPATLRIVLRQTDAAGACKRTSGGAPPAGRKMGEMLMITGEQGGRTLEIKCNYDKVVWSGMSWAVAEIPAGAFDPAQPVQIRCSSAEPDTAVLAGEIYAVRY